MLPLFRQRLVLMRGAPGADREELARALATSLPPRAAAVHYADIAGRWIVHHGMDAAAETALCYRLFKLICISMLKDGYTVIADAPFSGAAGEREMADLSKLARTFRGVRVTTLTFLAEGDGTEVAATRERLRHAVQEDEILIRGSGGDPAAFAAALLERIEGI